MSHLEESAKENVGGNGVDTRGGAVMVVGVGRLALNGTEVETKSVQFRVGLWREFGVVGFC